MLHLEATFWAAETDPAVIKQLCRHASERQISGSINTRWGDICARSLAQQAGVNGVTWERNGDDTPSNLTLRLIAAEALLPVFVALMHECDGVDDYELYLSGDADGAAPDN